MTNFFKNNKKLFNSLIIIVQAFTLFFLPPLLFNWLNNSDLFFFQQPIFYSSVINVVAFFSSYRILNNFEDHPQKNSSRYILPVVITIYLILMILILFLRFPYSLKILVSGMVGITFFLALIYVVNLKYKQIRIHVIPFGDVFFKNTNIYKFKRLIIPVLPKSRFNGILVDLHYSPLPPEWKRLVVTSVLEGIPVYNASQFRESLTGKVEVAFLNESGFGDLKPPGLQMLIKRFIDVLFIFLITPVLIPFILVIGLCIKIDSPGSIFFIQKRVGFNGYYFNLYKFRSMLSNNKGGYFTEVDESHRITRVGKVIRKYRFDELPQFWNVLKGEMSLIGPRPESSDLAKIYEQEVPFFNYRHVVKPGISGWAQVKQGYAAGVYEMKDKLAYDFYYIKHFSIWLDLLIWYKTIKTVLTGFGSR
jgi:lipopolysaccharide/colanic/teichoic acid biosynthesis glycosyltransferase